MYIENNRLVPWIEKVYLARRRNLLGEPNSMIFYPPPPLKKSTPPLWSNPGTATVILYKHILFSSVKISFVKELYSYNFCINVSGILSRNQGMQVNEELLRSSDNSLLYKEQRNKVVHVYKSVFYCTILSYSNRAFPIH